MDLQLLLDFSRRRRKSLLLLAAFGFSGYGLYRLYHYPSISKKRKTLVKLAKTLISVADAVSDSADSIGVVSRDLKLFLRSDSDEIPNSLKQISKIARSEEFSASLVRVTEALTIGVVRGYKSESKSEDESQMKSNFSDRVLDKVFSAAGSGFASVVVGSFARNLVLGFYSAKRAVEGLDSGGVGRLGCDGSAAVPGWVNWVCSDKFRELIGDCIKLFVSTAVAVYLDRTMEINTYDDIFTGLTNPKHESKVKDMLVSVCNGAIETLVKTSHQVLAVPRSSSGSNSSSISEFDKDKAIVDRGNDTISNTTQVVDKTELVSELSSERSPDELKDKDSAGWVTRVSSTLAVPSNRSFVLDVTGRVTFETVRSFLDFLLWKLLDGLKSGTSVVHGEALGRGLEVMRYIGAKSVVIATICLALCLHVVVGTRALVPAWESMQLRSCKIPHLS